MASPFADPFRSERIERSANTVSQKQHDLLLFVSANLLWNRVFIYYYILNVISGYICGKNVYVFSISSSQPDWYISGFWKWTCVWQGSRYVAFQVRFPFKSSFVEKFTGIINAMHILLFCLSICFTAPDLNSQKFSRL